MVMQCARGPSISSRKLVFNRPNKALFLVLAMLLSVFAGLVSVPIASATQGGDVAIISGVNPIPDTNYSQWDSIQPSVSIQNVGSTSTAPKAIKWETCKGDYADSFCGGGGTVKDGVSPIPALSPGQTTTVVFDSYFEYYNKPGLYTIVFRFTEEDQDTSNDALAYTFTLAEYFMDIDVDEEWDVRPSHMDYGFSDGNWVYNTNTDYPLYFKGLISSCLANCDFVLDAGWKMYDEQGAIIANNSISISNPGGESGQEVFNLTLPDLNSPVEGTYTLEYGVLHSTSDMNLFNNLASTVVTFNDTIDLVIEQMYPAYQPESSNYFYGEDAVEVVVKNIGNTSIINTHVELEVFTAFYDYESGPFTCGNLTLHPGRSIVCQFDMQGIGSKVLRATIPDNFVEGDDDKPADNVLTEIVDIVAGEINPVATQEEPTRIYDTSDIITLRAQVSSTAAKPLNYSWFQAGVVPWGFGKILDLNASEVQMGEHMFMLRVIDALGNSASAYTYMTIFNKSSLYMEPWLDGEAVTLTTAAVNASKNLPDVGVNYNLQSHLDALMVMDINIISTDPSNPDTGMERMDLEFNLSAIIPDSINRSSLTLFRLENATSTNWEQLSDDDEFSIANDETAVASLTSSGAYLLAGTLPKIDVSPGEIEVERLPGGQMLLKWAPEGELDNIYFGGWRIYRNSMPASTNMPFPIVDSVESEITWELLVTGHNAAELGAYNNSWLDPLYLDVGMCSTFFVVPIDRQSIPDYYSGNVSGITESGGFPQSSLSCGDSVAPETEVSQFEHTVTFTNDSECWSWYFDWSRCYVVNLTWTWPAEDANGAVAYNMYRLENEPVGTDLKLMTPVFENMSFTSGTSATFEQYGWVPNGPELHLTYFYVLAPIDEVGNVMYIQSFGSTENIEKVLVEDQYWAYREYLVPEPPPEPEPPYGIKYLGTFESYLEEETFQVAGMTFLILLCLNLIGLPLLRRRVKKFKRVIDRRGDGDDDDFSDFFD